MPPTRLGPVAATLPCPKAPPPAEKIAIETHRLIAGRYRLGDVLGRSLMSEVRLGEDVVLGRRVAVKLLRDYVDPRAVARFEQEARILARLQHPNVVTVFDSGVDEGDRFIVMELVEGPTLRELLDEQGRLAPERAAEIASGLALALGFAHQKGVIHRDVKPANVLLLRDGGVKLADMGIAKLLSPEALTATLTVRGTARYISPEQVRGDRVGAHADLYSLGCVLFEMLTGRTPFEGDLATLSYGHLNTPAPRVRSIDPAVPRGLDDLVAALLEKDPADRPQTGDEVRAALEAAMRQDAVTQTVPMEAVPPAPTHRPPETERVKPAARPAPTVVFQPGLIARSIAAKLKPPPWWTLPRGLAAIAVLLTAAGVFGALYATGVIGPRATGRPPTEGRPPAGRTTTEQPTSAPATTEPSAPQLLEPLANQVIPQNDSTIGCSFHPSFGFGFGIAFDWADSSSDVGIDGYEIFVEHRTATSPLVRTFVTESAFTFSRCNSFITDTNLEEWRWRVRARDVSGEFGEWSPFSYFRFEQCRIDGTPCSA